MLHEGFVNNVTRPAELPQHLEVLANLHGTAMGQYNNCDACADVF